MIRLDAGYKLSRTPEYDVSDWAELDALCKRDVDTPRAQLTPEQIAALLQQPESQSQYRNTGRKGIYMHGGSRMYANGCRCRKCSQGHVRRVSKLARKRKTEVLG